MVNFLSDHISNNFQCSNNVVDHDFISNKMKITLLQVKLDMDIRLRYAVRSRLSTAEFSGPGALSSARYLEPWSSELNADRKILLA